MEVLPWATKKIPGLYGKSDKHLAGINPNMMTWRMQGDMILIYKIIHDDDQFLCDFFMIIKSRTSDHNS